MKKRCVRFIAAALCALMLVPMLSCGKQIPPAFKSPISEIKLDGGYAAIQVEDGKFQYDVDVPLGNPRIPNVSVDAEGAVIRQDYCFNGGGSAKAEIRIGDGNGSECTYTVNFIPSGTDVELQYGDNFRFVPDYELKEGEMLKYTSSDIFTVYIDDTGYYYTRKQSEEPVTLTASVNGKTVGTLTVNRIVKAQALYVVLAGGPNATVEFGEKKTAECPREGIMYTVDMSSGSAKKHLGSGGILPPMAKKWNALTREKVIGEISALSTSDMTDWLAGGKCLSSSVGSYAKALEELKADDTDFEVRHYGFVYMGGENNHDADAAAYADMIVGVIDAHEAVHPFDFCAVVPCRASRTLATKPVAELRQLDGPRAAAFSLHNYRDNIFIGSLAAEGASVFNGLAESDNVRLSQACYNLIGTDIIDNAYRRMSNDDPVESLVVLGADGKNAAADAGAVPDGRTLAAYTLPLTSKTRLSVAVEGEGLEASKTGIIGTPKTTNGGKVTFTAADKAFTVTLGAYTKPENTQTDDPTAGMTLRQKVLYTMEAMATVKWISSYDVSHSGATYVSAANTPQKGLPYGSNRSNLADFMKQLVDGLYLGPKTTAVDNNCTSAIVWALAAADPKVLYMIDPAVSQTSSYLSPCFTGYGVSKLGDYEVYIPENPTEHSVHTTRIPELNTQAKMFECYALLEEGDYVMMRKYDNNSHARLVVSNTPVRNAKGEVTGGTIIVMEQGAGHVERNGAYSSFSTASSVSYKSLYDGFYVPMTLDAYHK